MHFMTCNSGMYYVEVCIYPMVTNGELKDGRLGAAMQHTLLRG